MACAGHAADAVAGEEAVAADTLVEEEAGDELGRRQSPKTDANC